MKELKKWIMGGIAVVVLVTVALVLLTGSYKSSTQQESTPKSVKEYMQDVLAWKKQSEGLESNQVLINNPQYTQYAGTSYGDWYAFALGRMNDNESYDAYLQAVKEQVENRYASEEKLDVNKATEWHRIGLTMTAIGGDPTKAGSNQDGSVIDLVADGTYLRGKEASLGKQGINGYIWALLLLDSKQYEIPENAIDTRESIITEILKKQNEDGGFAMRGSTSEVDITAMALQALAPYYSQEQTYSYANKEGMQVEGKTVRQVIDESLTFLEQVQGEHGDYESNGSYNAESTAQVIIALCTLGIDVNTDARFIKNGASVMDGLLRYRMEDGGFTHTLGEEANSDSMASEQALLALIAQDRLQEGRRSLYDCLDEMME